MQLPTPRGPLTEQLFRAMRSSTPVRPADLPRAERASGAHDRQLALWVLYEQHYRGFSDVDDDREWDPALVALRRELEADFEQSIRSAAAPLIEDALAAVESSSGDTGDVVDGIVAQLEHVTRSVDGPLTPYLQRKASAEQYREFLVHRSIYHLKESDPHAWAIPRLDGAAKVALAELQYDEFGSGVADALHSKLFADALEGAGLSGEYGAYIDLVTPETLAVNNAMSLFGLNRRLRGACVGHLAAFEMTSSLPCRRYLQGAERLRLDARVLRYFDEHVEADAVHELLAARDICGRLVEADPAMRADVLLGAAACVQLEAAAGSALVDAWQQGRSSLAPPAATENRRAVPAAVHGEVA